MKSHSFPNEHDNEPTHPDPGQQAEAAQRRAFHGQILDELASLGIAIARAVAERTLAETNDPAAREANQAAFDSVARTVRRTVMLADKLAAPRRTPAPAPAFAQHAAPIAAEARIAARRQIIRKVENRIQLEADPLDAESYRSELYERLDAPDLDYDIATRPIEAIISDIIDDLGLDPDRGMRARRRTPADLAILYARAAASPKPSTTVMTGLVPVIHAVPAEPASSVALSDIHRWPQPAQPPAHSPVLTDAPTARAPPAPHAPAPEPIPIDRESG